MRKADEISAKAAPSRSGTGLPARTTVNGDRIVLFESTVLDLVRGSLLRAEEPVHLRPQSYEVLLYLAENKGRLIGKNELLDAVWEGRAVTDGSLGKCIEEVQAGIERDAWNWTAAEREYRRALELNPNLADAHVAYSNHLSLMGRPDQALAELRRAQDLDPLRTEWRKREAWVLVLAGRKEAALEIERTLVPEPDANLYSSGLMKAAMGRYEEAIDLYRKSLATRGENTSTLCYLSYALAQVGKRDEALAVLDRLETGQQYVSPVELAVLYAGVNDKEGALASLEKAYAAHDLQIQTLLVEPHLDGLRSDPRFQDLLRRVGLS